MLSVQTELPTPQDGGWGYVCIVAVFILQFLFGIVVRTFGIIYLLLLDRFNTTATLASWVGATNLLVFAVTGPVSAMLCRKFSHRSVAIAGSLLNCIGFIIIAYSPNIGTVYLGFGLFAGIGIAMTDVASNLILDKYFLKKKSIAVSIASCGAGVSMFVVPSLMNYCEDEYGFQGTVLIVAGILLNGVVCAAFLRPLEYSTQSSKENMGSKNQSQMFLHKMINGNKGVANINEPENVVLTSAKKLNTNEISELKVLNLTKDNVINQNRDSSGMASAGVAESIKKSGLHEHQFDTCETDKKDQMFVNDNTTLSNDKGKLQSRSESRNQAEMGGMKSDTCMSQENEYPMVQNADENTPKDQNKNPANCINFQPCVALLNDVPAVIGLLILSFALTFSDSSVFSFLPALVIDKGISEEDAKLLISWAGISDVVLRIPFGFIMDYPKIRPYRIYLISIIALIPAAVTLTFPFYSKHLPFIIGVVVFAGVVGILFAQRVTVTSYLTGPQWTQQAFGFVVTLNGLGHVAGRLIGGVIKDHTGSYETIFFISGSIMAISAVIFLMMTIFCWKNKTH